MTIRIITPGVIIASENIPYTGHCMVCGCIFECHKSNIVTRGNHSAVGCPTCKEIVYTLSPKVVKPSDPRWTVFYNIVSPENGKWIGMGWEFFDKESDAKECSLRQEKLGNVPTTRPYHSTDRKQMGACHR